VKITIFVVYALLQVGSIGCAFRAALLWLKSAQVTLPENFPITVVKPDMAPMGQPIGGTYMGHGYCKELANLASALAGQSNLSGSAARWTAASAGFQILASVAAAPLAFM
jgi:hypothetical protein